MKIFLIGQSGTFGTALKEQAKLKKLDIEYISRTIPDDISGIRCDLADVLDIEKSLDEIENDQQDSIAILNSGVLGPVGHVGDIDLKDMLNVFNVNALSNIALFQSLYRKGVKRFVVISSGAANKNYSGWFTYCLSKRMQKAFWEGICHDHTDVSAKLIAPGVLASKMHDFTQTIDRSNYPELDKFFELKETSGYQNESESAEKMFSLIMKENFFANDCEFIDLREI